MPKRACRRDPAGPDGCFSSERRSRGAIVCVAPILLIGGAFDVNSTMWTAKSAISIAAQRRATEIASFRANSAAPGHQSRAAGWKGGGC